MKSRIANLPFDVPEPLFHDESKKRDCNEDDPVHRAPPMERYAGAGKRASEWQAKPMEVK